jgi:hypothetical protein
MPPTAGGGGGGGGPLAPLVADGGAIFKEPVLMCRYSDGILGAPLSIAVTICMTLDKGWLVDVEIKDFLLVSQPRLEVGDLCRVEPGEGGVLVRGNAGERVEKEICLLGRVQNECRGCVRAAGRENGDIVKLLESRSLRCWWRERRASRAQTKFDRQCSECTSPKSPPTRVALVTPWCPRP